MQRFSFPRTVLTSVGFVVLGLMVYVQGVVAQDGRAPVTVVVEFPQEESLAGTTLAAPERTQETIIQELVLPTIETKSEKEQRVEEAALRLLPQPRVFGSFLRYERVNIDNNGGLDLDGNIYTANLQLRWEVNDFSYGVLVPFDYLDLKDVNAYRIGAVGFGEYRLTLSPEATLDFMLHALYSHTDFDTSALDNINTFGGGPSISLTLDYDQFVVGMFSSYQITTEDSDLPTDVIQLFRLGANVGARIGSNVALTVFAVWNRDITDYSDTLLQVDKDYFDVGLEAVWNLTPTWRLAGGYKKVVGLNDFDSNMVFLGSLWRF